MWPIQSGVRVSPLLEADARPHSPLSAGSVITTLPTWSAAALAATSDVGAMSVGACGFGFRSAFHASWTVFAEAVASCRGSRTGDAPETFDDASEEVLRKIHRTIADVTADFEAFRFNRAVARIRELTNALANLDGDGADRASWHPPP